MVDMAGRIEIGYDEERDVFVYYVYSDAACEEFRQLVEESRSE